MKMSLPKMPRPTLIEQELLTQCVMDAAPEYITDFITITLRRRGGAARFNNEVLPNADLMGWYITKELDEAIYGRGGPPDIDPFQYLLKGETVAGGTHAETHLHYHAVTDFSDPSVAARFVARRDRFERRLKKLFLKLGHHITFHYETRKPEDRDRTAAYIAKACWVDIERFYRRKNGPKSAL